MLEQRGRRFHSKLLTESLLAGGGAKIGRSEPVDANFDRPVSVVKLIRMAKENSFDIVSKTDYAEVTNAINQTAKEVSQRFDFKGSKAAVELNDKDLLLTAEDDTRLRNMNDILQGKMIKRGISLKALDYQKIEPAAGGTVRQVVKIQQGIPIEKAKEVVKFIKDAKLKVQASIQGETVRVSGKDRDTLQDVIAKLKEKDFGIDMKFDNYRTN